MARLARLVVPEVPHHVTRRGNRRPPVFFGEEDYAAYRPRGSEAFIETLEASSGRSLKRRKPGPKPKAVGN